MPLGAHVEDSETAVSVWVVAGLLFTGAVWATDALLRRRWTGGALGLCTAGLAAGTLAFTFEVLEPTWEGAPEVFLALSMGALLAASIPARQRWVLVVSGLILAGDAVVFAFDVGGRVLGVVSLLVVAGALLGLATLLRRRLQAW